MTVSSPVTGDVIVVTPSTFIPPSVTVLAIGNTYAG
jgi:hypothetical protein